MEGKNWRDARFAKLRVSGQAQSSLNAGQLEFILGVLADLVARKFLGDVFEQVDAQSALLPAALDQTEAEREEVFRREGFFFLKRFEHRIGRVAVKIGRQLDGGMLAMACHRVRVQFELRRSEMKLIFRFDLGKIFERRKKPTASLYFFALTSLAPCSASFW